MKYLFLIAFALLALGAQPWHKNIKPVAAVFQPWDTDVCRGKIMSIQKTIEKKIQLYEKWGAALKRKQFMNADANTGDAGNFNIATGKANDSAMHKYISKQYTDARQAMLSLITSVQQYFPSANYWKPSVFVVGDSAVSRFARIYYNNFPPQPDEGRDNIAKVADEEAYKNSLGVEDIVTLCRECVNNCPKITQSEKVNLRSKLSTTTMKTYEQL